MHGPRGLGASNTRKLQIGIERGTQPRLSSENAGKSASLALEYPGRSRRITGCECRRATSLRRCRESELSLLAH